MTGRFRAPIALAEEQDSIPSTHIVANNCLSPVLGDMTLSSDLHRYQASLEYTSIHLDKNTNTHKIK